jgi:hypothetical protein
MCIHFHLGSCAAAIELIKQLKGEIVDCVMLVDIGLNWSDKVKEKVTSFINL